MKLTKAKLRQIIKEELEVILTDDEAVELFGDYMSENVELREGTIPFHVVQQMAPNLPRGHAVILGKRFENTPDGRSALKRALQDGSWKGLIK